MLTTVSGVGFRAFCVSTFNVKAIRLKVGFKKGLGCGALSS